MKSPDEYFRMGAEAMQGKLAALAIVHGSLELAQKILAAEVPAFQEPEQMTLHGNPKQDEKEHP